MPDSADGTLIASFRPRIIERVLAVTILFVGLGELALGVATTLWHPVTTIECDRTTCHGSFPSLFAGTSDVTLQVADLRDSRVASARNGEQRWQVTSKGVDISLGDPTSKDELIEIYRRSAADLQAFLADPNRKTFSATYAGLAGPTGILFAILGLVFAAWGLSWIRGWHAEFFRDDRAGALVIRQRPLARRRAIPLGDIASVDASERTVQLAYGFMRYARITLRGRNGKALFSYRTLYDGHSYKAVNEKLVALRAAVKR
jgi:hypothetical protein